MRGHKISRMQFIIVSCLGLAVILSLSQLAELRYEQEMLRDEIIDLSGVYEKNRTLAEQLQAVREQIVLLRQRNQSLEELLSNRVRTYLIATGSMPARTAEGFYPSRSGLDGSYRSIDLLNMPVQSKSGFLPEDFERIWERYNAVRLKGTGEALIRAENESGINALVLAAIIVHESHFGESALAVHKNNLAGLGAYNGRAGRTAMSFATKEDCIAYLADFLAREYVTPGGKYYHGGDLAAIGKSYAADPNWSFKVAQNIRRLVTAAIEDPAAMLDLYQARAGEVYVAQSS